MTRGAGGVVHFVVPDGHRRSPARERRQRLRPARAETGCAAIGWDVRMVAGRPGCRGARRRRPLASAGGSARAHRRPDRGPFARSGRGGGGSPAHRGARAHGVGGLPGRGSARGRGRAPRASQRATRDRDERVDAVRAGRGATSSRRTGSSSRRPGSDDAPAGDRNARRRRAPVRRRRRAAQGAGHPDRGAGSSRRRRRHGPARSPDRSTPVPTTRIAWRRSRPRPASATASR